MAELYLTDLMQSCKHDDEVFFFCELNEGQESGKKKGFQELCLRHRESSDFECLVHSL